MVRNVFSSEKGRGNHNSACTTAVDALSDFVDAHELASVYLLFENWECPSHWRPCFLAIAIQAGLVLYVEHAWARRTNHPGKPLLRYAVILDQARMCGSVTSPYIRSAAMVELLLRLVVDIGQEFEGMSALGWSLQQRIIEEGFSRPPSGIISNQRTILKCLLKAGDKPKCSTTTRASNPRSSTGL